jgi:hypothetical protein
MRLVGTPPRAGSHSEDRLRHALLAVQPGGEGLLALCATHVTVVAHQIPRVPGNSGVVALDSADGLTWMLVHIPGRAGDGW